MAIRRFDPVTRSTATAVRAPRTRARQAEGGARGARTAGDALLDLQRRYGNRYVGQVVEAAHRQRHMLRDRDADREAVDVGTRRAIRRARGGGRTMPEAVRAPLEAALGADLRAVRVHVDGRADELSRSLRAEAFTTGRDVFFRRGAFEPRSRQGSMVLAHELTHVLQQDGGPAAADGVVQLNRPRDFKTYAEAKNATPYAQKHLDEQANDEISGHVGKDFNSSQRKNIYAVNEAANQGDIRSEVGDQRVLVLQDTGTTPHVDHRYPKAKAGSNSYKNAAVIPARANLQKSDMVDLDDEPDEALPPYQKLVDPAPPGVQNGKEFSAEQKDKIYKANINYYDEGGEIVSDLDEETILAKSDSASVAHIDHMTPASSGGTNYYFNARVMSAQDNIRKSGERGGQYGEDKFDWVEGEMTLKEYILFKQKKIGVPKRLTRYSSDEEERFAEREEQQKQKHRRKEKERYGSESEQETSLTDTEEEEEKKRRDKRTLSTSTTTPTKKKKK